MASLFTPTVIEKEKHKSSLSLSDSHRKNISQKLKGRIFTKEWKNNISISSKGKKKSKIHKQHLSIAFKGRIPWNKGIKMDEKYREKMRVKKGPMSSVAREKMKGRIPWNKGVPFLAVRGEKNHNWKGGITEKNNAIRTSLEYKIWRRAVYERDNYSCIWCGDRQQKDHKVILQADHIKPFAWFPELRFAIDNGRTLCISCHQTTFSYKNHGQE